MNRPEKDSVRSSSERSSFSRGILHSIRGRLLLLLVLVLVPILGVQFLLYRDRIQDHRTMEIRSHLEMARAVSEYFDHFTLRVARQGQAIGSSLLSLNPSSEEIQKVIDGIDKVYRGFQHISLVGPDGRIVASSKPTAVGLDVRDRAYYREIVGGREWYVSDLFYSRADKTPVFVVSTGIRGETGTLQGLVLTSFAAEKFEHFFSLDHTKGGNITLIDRNGRAVYRYPEITWSWESRDLTQTYPDLKRSTEGTEFSGITSDTLDGKRRAFAMCAIRSAGWVVRVSRPEAEAMDPVYAEMVGNAGLSFMVVIGSFLAALLFSRRISSPLGQLRNHAMVLKAGKYTDRIELRGVREIEVLAQAFNSMAEQIRRREEQLDKWVEDALKKKAEMEAVFSSMSNAVIIYDSHGNVAQANPAALEAYGFDIVKAGQAELAKRIRIRHADQSPLSTDSLPSRRALLGEKVLGQRLIITDEAGHERVILTSASPLLLDEKPFGAVVVWQDNTELEKLHQQIEYRNRLLQGVIDHAPARIAIFDAKEPRMILASQAFRDALEDPYKSESLQGIRLEDCIPAAEETGLLDIFKRVASTGQAHFDPEYEFLLSGREKSFWNWSLVPLRGPEGVIEHLLLTAVDVTDQVKQKEALRKARDNLDLLVQERTAQLQVANTALLDYTRQLEAKNKELADFSFLAAHDLQEPLRKIQLFSDLIKIKFGPLLNDRGRNYLDRMAKAADRSRNLIRAVHAFSMLTSRSMPFQCVDLNVLIRKVLENLRDPIVQAGAAIEVGKMPVLEAEGLQMHLLFENLLRNSLTFVRERPVIKITSEEVKETTPSGEKRLHRITVEDNGIGFEQEMAEKAFKPFGRLHDQERYPGIGMGLALCRKIVELHGGTISAKSRRGKGSTFTIRFPAEPVDP